MKRIGGIYNEICSVENLHVAHAKASRGKNYQPGVKKFAANLEANIMALHTSLVNKTYKISPYNTFTIYEPKERTIFSLPYVDRVAQHAIMNPLEQMFVACFTADTYSCIKGRGIHAASYALRKALLQEEQTKYCLKLDVKKFYPSINHDILKQQLRRKIKDNDLLWLLDGIIDSAPGVPIGNYLSQYFANYYLTPFDIWLKQTMHKGPYFRYADDMVLLADNKPYLHNLLEHIKEYLHDTVQLQVKENYQVFPVAARGIDFLGYIHYHNNYVCIRPSIKRAFARKLAAGTITPLGIASYKGWLKHANAKHLLKKLLTNHEQLFTIERTAGNQTV